MQVCSKPSGSAFLLGAQRFSAAINAAKAMTALAAEVPDGIHFEVPAQTPLPFGFAEGNI